MHVSNPTTVSRHGRHDDLANINAAPSKVKQLHASGDILPGTAVAVKM